MAMTFADGLTTGTLGLFCLLAIGVFLELKEKADRERRARREFAGNRCAATSEPRLHPRVVTEAPAAGRPSPPTLEGRPASSPEDAA